MARTQEELEILNHYGISKLTQVTTEMFIDMQSRLSRMSPEVAKAIIAQIPEYVRYASEQSNAVNATVSDLIKSDDDESVLNYQTRNIAIDHWIEQSNRKDITSEERMNYEEMIAQSIKDADANAADKRRYHFNLVGLEILAGIVGLLFMNNLFGADTKLRFPAKS